MTMRGILLKIHLCLGLAAALFLVILGLTGSVMAFEDDIVPVRARADRGGADIPSGESSSDDADDG